MEQPVGELPFGGTMKVQFTCGHIGLLKAGTNPNANLSLVGRGRTHMNWKRDLIQVQTLYKI